VHTVRDPCVLFGRGFPARMIRLVADLGNSALKLGLADSGGIVRTARLPHDSDIDAGIRQFVSGYGVTSAGIVAVVPKLVDAVVSAIERATDAKCSVFNASSVLPFDIAYATPETLGPDRIAAAAAAWANMRKSDASRIIVVDAGTAVTYEVIDRPGIYLGGAIAPGPAIQRDALVRGTARLPEVDLTLPEQPIGRSTVECLQAGIMFGFLDSVEGMLRRLEAAGGTEVVLTGGWAETIADGLKNRTFTLRRHFVLEGVLVLLEASGAAIR
jgi:type III pantothenate kinase